MPGCECFIFAIIIIASIVSNLSKVKSNSDDSSNVNLDDIFNDIVKTSRDSSGSLPSSQRASFPPSNQPVAKQFQRKRTKSLPGNVNTVSRQSMSSPTIHTDHNCEEVNYDNLGSLEGGTGSFNLGVPEEPARTSYREQTKISIGREDLLKSFVMSEVLQRYDINRIYSRIPSVKSDE